MRTTAEAVKAIMDDISLTDSEVEEYISSASTMVDEVLSNSGVSSSLLTEIERWLTAHMIAITRERLAKKEEAGGAKIEYTGTYGAGLNSTSYGQMVLGLDFTGSFASLAGKKAFIRSIES